MARSHLSETGDFRAENKWNRVSKVDIGMTKFYLDILETEAAAYDTVKNERRARLSHF